MKVDYVSVSHSRYKKHREHIADFTKRFPWIVRLWTIKTRCNYHPRYAGKGIKCLLTKSEIEFLWFRDKAFELSRPSIDRIDNAGHYELSNCRFIELSENSGRANRGKIISQIRCSVCGQKQEAFGLCKKHYSVMKYQLKKKQQNEI